MGRSANRTERREVSQLVRRCWHTHSAAYMTSVFELDSKLRQLYRVIPTELKSEDVMSSNIPERTQRNALFLHSIYYLCLVYLHASVVPGFSGSKVRLQISTSLVEFCAKTALLNANLYADMAKGYLATIPDFTRLPSFVGYCAFIAGSVHGVMLGLTQTSYTSSSWANGIVCLLVLEELKVYWPSLGILVCTFPLIQKQLAPSMASEHANTARNHIVARSEEADKPRLRRTVLTFSSDDTGPDT